MLTVALGLAASLVWGSADFLGGLCARGRSLWGIVLVAQLAGLALAGTVLLIASTPVPSAASLATGAGAGVAGAVAIAAFYRALAVGTMGVVAPIAGTGAVVPVVVGLAGGETPSAGQLLGAAVATVGVVLASREVGADGDAPARRTESLVLAAIAALGFGLVLTGLEIAGDGDPYWAILAARVASSAAVVAVVVARRPPLELRGGGLRTLVLIGLLDTGANVLFVLAAEEGLLSVVAVLGSLYPVVTVLLARFVLDERLRRVQGAGVALTLAGVALLAAA